MTVKESQAGGSPAIAQRRASHKPKLSKTIINFCLDALLLVLFLSLIWVTAVLRFVFPAGTAAGEWELWGWTVERWRDLQFGITCALTMGILVHVMLHWSWVCGVLTTRFLRRNALRNDGLQTLFGVGVLLVLLHLLGALMLWAGASIHQTHAIEQAGR